jgi:SAM-dependent methyltransferase
MGLVSLATIEPLFVCPRCRARLDRSDQGFTCSAASCELSAPGSFRVQGGVPILVDFDHSILRPGQTDGEPVPLVAPKWSVGRLPHRVRSLWKPVNSVAARNVDLLLSRLPGGVTVLVVGGGTIGNGVERLYSDPGIDTIAFDVYRSELTQFVADAHQIPLAACSVDAVVVQAVLEHVVNPERVVEEIWRVLRDDGLVYAETPFLQQVHAGAYDFVRFTSSGHRYLFRRFAEIAAGPVAGPGTQLLWSIDHLVRGLTRSEIAGKLARGLLFWLRYLDRAIPERYAMDDASAYYFLGRRVEHELEPRQLVDYYKGAQRSAAQTTQRGLE